MKYKTFRKLNIIAAGLLGVIIAISVTLGNAIIPIVAMAIFTALIATFRFRVTDIPISDERLDKIAGKASRMVYIITTYILAIATVIFAALSKTYPVFFGYSTLASTTCIGMMLIYIIAFNYYNKKKD